MLRSTGFGAALLAVVMTAVPCPLIAQSEAWPAKNIQIVVGFPVGGIIDTAVRALAAKMPKTLGTNLVTVPVPGAGGAIAMQKIARATPDGYTLMMVPSGTLHARPYQMGLPVSSRDFTPIATAAVTFTTIAVKKSHRWTSFADLIREAKAHPGKLSFASPAVGGNPHLGMEIVAQMTGIKVLNVPYQGGPPAILGVLGGETDFIVGDVAHPEIRPLATINPARSPYMPDVPTLRELGIPADFSTRLSLVAPRNLPAAIAQKLEAAVKAALQDAEVRQQFATLELIVSFESGTELEQLWPEQDRLYREVIDRLGLAHHQQGKKN